MSGLVARVWQLIGGSRKKPQNNHDTVLAKQKPCSGVFEEAPVDLPMRLDTAFYEIVFQSTILSKPLSVPENLVLQVVEGNLRQRSFRSRSVPRLPSVVPQLMRSLRDPRANATEYVRIIQQDPVIAAAVLKMANSAYFNPSNKRIDSFQRAVVTLGTDGLRSILSTAVMQPIIQCKTPYFTLFGKKLWDHSVCCAVCCQILAGSMRVDPFKAYLAGLVHDIGPITIFTQLSQEFKLNENNAPPAHVFFRMISDLGNELSHLIVSEWELPEDLHQAVKEQINANEGSQLSALGTVVFRANQICEAYVLVKNGMLPQAQAIELLKHWELPTDLYKSLDLLLDEISA